MGCLGIVTCTIHSISAQIRQEGLECTEAKGLTVLHTVAILLNELNEEKSAVVIQHT